MLFRFFTSIPPQPSLFSYQTRRIIWSRCTFFKMGLENYDPLIQKTNKKATFRLCNVAGYKADLLEMHAKDPKFHVVFIPGNPGVISFYTDFLESLYELLGGSASITAIGNIGQTEKDWEKGKLFSLQDQIDHKVNFIEHEIEDVASPILLVGHSIGAHIAMEIYRRFQDKVIYCIALYPFLAMNRESSAQMVISRISGSTILCYLVSSIVGLLGNLPTRASRFLVRKTIGSSWSSTAVEALCSHLFQYHTMRNVLFMVQTEFKELSGTPDWRFMRERKNQIAFLFGNDDHWGPLHMYEEVSAVHDLCHA
ncbi:hypothetical protein Leryth_000971 [Lithospermum erythrorhizon]|nr:hypothetical protein Leryth_000971 [Lithospermum erythrorhizon]